MSRSLAFMMDTVSICIPTYNGGPYLAACLASAQAQTHTALDILIVDDTSGDDSVEIARRAQATDPRIRVVVNPTNLGLVGNWNQCVALANGKWIKFLFQDDLLHPDCVSRLIDCAASGPHRLVACDRDFLFEGAISDDLREMYQQNRRQVRSFLAPGAGSEAAAFAVHITRRITQNWVGEPTCVLMQRSIFDDHGAFDSGLAQLCDWEYWVRVASSEGIGFVDEPLASFRVHAGATSALNRQAKAFSSGALDYLRLIDMLLTEPQYEQLRAAWQAHGADLLMRQERTRWRNQVRRFVRVQRRQHPDALRMEADYRKLLADRPGCAVDDLEHWLWLAGAVPAHYRHCLAQRLRRWVGTNLRTASKIQ